MEKAIAILKPIAMGAAATILALWLYDKYIAKKCTCADSTTTEVISPAPPDGQMSYTK
jgi:hypothetical protein